MYFTNKRTVRNTVLQFCLWLQAMTIKEAFMPIFWNNKILINLSTLLNLIFLYSPQTAVTDSLLTGCNCYSADDKHLLWTTTSAMNELVLNCNFKPEQDKQIMEEKPVLPGLLLHPPFGNLPSTVPILSFRIRWCHLSSFFFYSGEYLTEAGSTDQTGGKGDVKR